MAVQLNHTIVYCRDQQSASAFWTDVFGLSPATRFGPFLDVEVANGVTFAFHDSDPEYIIPQHYAFLVSESEFDEIIGRVVDKGLGYWADPMKSEPGEINHHDGGRGV